MNDDRITLNIDGIETTVKAGTTILEAAAALDIDIPIICYHEATTPNGLCRLCVVDVDGHRLLQPACIAECRAGAQVATRNERVERSRRTILAMLASATDLSEAPDLLNLLREYGADAVHYPDARRREHDLKDDNPFYIRDYSQCVLCWRCVQVCAEDAQYTFALTLGERGYDTRVATSFAVAMPESPCVFCGQCIGVCPTGALKPKVEWGLERGLSPEEIRQSTRRPRRRKEGQER